MCNTVTFSQNKYYAPSKTVVENIQNLRKLIHLHSVVHTWMWSSLETVLQRLGMNG